MSPIADYYKEYPLTLPDLSNVDDGVEDQPRPGAAINELGPLKMPSVVFGAATLSHHYNDYGSLATDSGYRAVRLALKYGITAFDTSPYYGSSEVLLGNILMTLTPQYPRESYRLITKCGRYGLRASQFDYTPSTIRESVFRSLQRLKTTYLDLVYLHDAEYVASPIFPNPRSGNYVDALKDKAESWGLAPGDEARVRGSGDQQILDAVTELLNMKREGVIRAIGITGYSLPSILRLSILISNRFPNDPLDAVLSFCHLTLQNSALLAFLPVFKSKARVRTVLSASPLSMGLLTSSPPIWHPAPKSVLQATRDAVDVCSHHGGLPNIALGYSFRSRDTNIGDYQMPIVIGFSDTSQVHEAVQVLRDISGEASHETTRLTVEKEVQDLYSSISHQGWSWPSPAVED